MQVISLAFQLLKIPLLIDSTGEQEADSFSIPLSSLAILSTRKHSECECKLSTLSQEWKVVQPKYFTFLTEARIHQFKHS